MNINKRKEIAYGRDLWQEYLRVNQNVGGRPTNEGIKKLARLLDLKQSHVRKHIENYLYDC